MNENLLFEEAMDNLQKLWESKEEVFNKTCIKGKKIRRSQHQIATLVYALIKLGIIDYNSVRNIKE